MTLLKSAHSASAISLADQPILHDIIFLDAGVANAEPLLRGATAPIHLLEAGQDGLEQISQILQATPSRRVHLVTHGSPGAIRLGSSELSLDTLELYAEKLRTWFTTTEAPELLIYGCNVAAGDAGEEFLAKLQGLTGASIAASTTLVGQASLDGNWELDSRWGNPEATLAFHQSALEQFEGVLATFTVTTTADSGPGSLRDALKNSNNKSLTPENERSEIVFDIPADQLDANGVAVFQPQTLYPKVFGFVSIDGYTQTGATANTATIGSNAQLKIVIDGSQLGTFNNPADPDDPRNGRPLEENGQPSSGSRGGLDLEKRFVNGAVLLPGQGVETTVKGLVIQGFPVSGIRADTPRATIQGNFIGTDVTGTQANGATANQGSGIAASELNFTMGADPDDTNAEQLAARNIISGNTSNGISIFGGPNRGHTIQGNLIGTGAAGTEDLGNGGNGVLVNSSDNTIQNNVIANNRNGVRVVNGTQEGGEPVIISNNIIANNTITNSDRFGVSITASGTTVTDNDISNYGDGGISIADDERTVEGTPETFPSSGNTVSGNTFIDDNNDPAITDNSSGPNTLQEETAPNQVPTLTTDNGTVVVDEGSTASNSGTFGDLDGDTVQVTASFNNQGLEVDANSGTWTWSYDTLDGPYDNRNVTITASDGKGGVTTVNFQLTVNNVDPTLSTEPNFETDENTPLTITPAQLLANAFDPAGENDTLTVSLGDLPDVPGTFEVEPTDGSIAFDPNGEYVALAEGETQLIEIPYTIEDEDGGVSAVVQANLRVIGVNDAPELAIASTDAIVDEGQEATATGTFSDPDSSLLNLTASIGEVVDNNDGTWAWSYTPEDDVNQPETVTITVQDDQGLESNVEFQLTVNDVVPPEPTPNSAIDFNNDGQSDLLWQNSSTGEAFIWYMNGGSYLGGESLGTASSEWQLIDATDLNDDGNSDLLWHNSSTGEAIAWYMNGDAYLGSSSLGTVSTDWQLVGTSDFNNDGNSDLLWHNSANGKAVAWYANGGGTYVASQELGAVSTDWQLVGTSDVNNDGNSDLLWHNSITGKAVTWYMDDGTYLNSQELGGASTEWQLIGASDFNSDANSDLLWQNSNSGEAVTWYLNGGTYAGSQTLGTVPTQWQLVG